MGYSNETNAAAIKIIVEKRKKALAQYENLLAAAYNGIPRLKEIDTLIAKSGAAGITAALNGNTDIVNKLAEESLKLQDEKSKILCDAGVIKPEPNCAACGDTGYVSGKVCNCVMELAKTVAIEKLSEKMPLGECTFNNFSLNYYADDTSAKVNPRKTMSAIFNMCKNYAQSFNKTSENLLFMGGVGLGKTHLSLSIVYEVTNKGFGVVYGSAQDLFSAAESEHYSFSGSTEVLTSLLNADLLVIDDLGTEYTSPYVNSLFYNVINTRLLQKKPTIINTNLSIKELEQRYTPRIASRFIGSFKLIKFFGNDIRQQKALEK